MPADRFGCIELSCVIEATILPAIGVRHYKFVVVAVITIAACGNGNVIQMNVDRIKKDIDLQNHLLDISGEYGYGYVKLNRRENGFLCELESLAREAEATISEWIKLQ